ncbi:MAG: hypothetical protein ACI841_004509 [Planctomycetota bacterium]|jgi:hypothetical protein
MSIRSIRRALSGDRDRLQSQTNTDPMRTNKLQALLPAALLLFSTVATSQSGETKEGELVELAFRPAEDLVLRKRWTSRQNLRPAIAYVTFGSEREEQNLNMSLDATQCLVVSDKTQGSLDGRPRSVRRLYERASIDTTLTYTDQKPIVMEQVSALQGSSVVFTWVEAEQTYGKYYDTREAPETMLAGLWQDIDLRSLLPEVGTARIGDRWSLPAVDLALALAPGGDIPQRAPESSEPMTLRSLRAGVGAHLFRVFEKVQGTGSMDLSLTKVEQRDSGNIAIIDIVIGIRLSSDQTHYVRSQMSGTEKSMGAVYHGSDLIFELRGSGRLEWNVDLGHAESFTLNGEQETSYRISNSYRRDGDTVREQFMRMRGRFELDLAVEQLADFPDAVDDDEGFSVDPTAGAGSGAGDAKKGKKGRAGKGRAGKGRNKTKDDVKPEDDAVGQEEPQAVGGGSGDGLED